MLEAEVVVVVVVVAGHGAQCGAGPWEFPGRRPRITPNAVARDRLVRIVSSNAPTSGPAPPVACLAIAAPSARAADGLMAAYDTYVSGSGFQVRLVNASTGAQISLPSGVNTTADELHPTLSHDGRYLVFMRTQLAPTLAGDIVPPAARTIHLVHRTAGTVTQLAAGESPSGPTFGTFAPPATSSLAWGIAHRREIQTGAGTKVFALASALFGDGTLNPSSSPFTFLPVSPTASQDVLTTHAAGDGVSQFDPVSQTTKSFGARYLTLAVTDRGTGAISRSFVHLSTLRAGGPLGIEGTTRDVGDAAAPAAHPSQRPADETLALHHATGSEADIKTFKMLGTGSSVEPTTAPAPITTTDAERLPAGHPTRSGSASCARPPPAGGSASSTSPRASRRS